MLSFVVVEKNFFVCFLVGMEVDFLNKDVRFLIG